MTDPDYLEAAIAVRRAFDLERPFHEEKALTVGIVVPGPWSTLDPWRRIRTIEMVRELSRSVRVRLAVPDGPDLPEFTPETVHVLPWEPGELDGWYHPHSIESFVQRVDLVIADAATVAAYRPLQDCAAIVAVDLDHPGEPATRAGDPPGVATSEDIARVLGSADFFLVRNMRQRDHWLGRLTAADRVDPSVYAYDSNLGFLVGLAPDAPLGPPIGGDPPGGSPTLPFPLDDDEILALWGGASPVADATTALVALRRVAAERPEVRLAMIVASEEAAAAVRDEAARLGVPSHHFAAVADPDPSLYRALVERADIGVHTTRDVPLARLTHNPLLAHLAGAGGGTALVATGPEEQVHGLARAGACTEVATCDAAALAAVLRELVVNPTVRAEQAAAAAAWAKDCGGWTASVEPLQRIVAAPWRHHDLRQERRRTATRTFDTQLLLEQRRVHVALLAQQLERAQRWKQRLRESRVGPALQRSYHRFRRESGV